MFNSYTYLVLPTNVFELAKRVTTGVSRFWPLNLLRETPLTKNHSMAN